MRCHYSTSKAPKTAQLAQAAGTTSSVLQTASLWLCQAGVVKSGLICTLLNSKSTTLCVTSTRQQRVVFERLPCACLLLALCRCTLTSVLSADKGFFLSSSRASRCASSKWSARWQSPVLVSVTMKSVKRSTCPDAFSTTSGVTAGHSTCTTQQFMQTLTWGLSCVLTCKYAVPCGLRVLTC